MASIVRRVREISAAERQVYETLLGRRLEENQQIIIRVLTPGVVPPEETRREALGRAEAIARQGRANAAAQDVSDDELDAAIDEAILHARSHPQSR